MQASSVILKRWLLALILLVLFLPMLENTFRFAGLKVLNGDITLPKDDTLNAAGWFSGSYQQKKETYINDLFGFRNFCVRLNNQVLYTFFNKGKAKGLVVGKENYLFEIGYIESYMGKDCIGADSANKILEKLKFISDQLAAANKQLLLVFAPGKASFYSEFIPDQFSQMGSCTNYELLSKGAVQRGVHVLDLNAWFRAEKARSKYPLYPQYGIHWSKYGSVLAADTIIKTIERLRGIDMPNLYYDSLTMGPPEGLDYDMGDGMNMFEKLKSFDMATVKVKTESAAGKATPAVLVISDSFYWGMYDFGIGKSFKNDHFWYYNKKVYPESFKQDKYVNELSLKRELNNHDVVVIMATEPNLRSFGWNFIESANKLYKGRKLPHSAGYFKRLKDLCAYIRQDAVWLEATIKKAKAGGVSLDEQVKKEAEWVLENDGVY